MNNYITLDGKKYRTLSRSWRRKTTKAGQARVNLDGSLDVTYAPATIKAFEGEIEGPVTPDDASWGTISELKTSLEKLVGLSLTDHESVSYTAHVIGEIPEESFSPMWDGASNVVHVSVYLVVS